jgi:hypothetical protein
VVTTTSVRSAASAGARLPVQRTRRPTFAALAVLLILVGALASAWLVYRSGNRVDVLVAREDVTVGQVMTADDFAVARVATDDAPVIIASAIGNFTDGTTRATSNIPAGTVLNASMFLSGDTVPEDGVVVGLVLTPQQRPAVPLQPGDVVRVYLVPPDEAGGTVKGAPGDTIASAVTVYEVAPAPDSAQELAISVLVPADESGDVVAAASAGQLAVARLAAGTEPDLDTVDD